MRPTPLQRVQSAIQGNFGDQIIVEHFSTTEELRVRDRFMSDVRNLMSSQLVPKPGFVWAVRFQLEQRDTAGAKLALELPQFATTYEWPEIDLCRRFFIEHHLDEYVRLGLVTSEQLVAHVHEAMRNPSLFKSLELFCRCSERSAAIPTAAFERWIRLVLELLNLRRRRLSEESRNAESTVEE